MRQAAMVAVVIVACCASAPAQEVQLDLSSGFNWDIWCGAKEFQALMLHAQDYWGIDLVEMQGSDNTHNGPTYLLGNGQWLICGIDAAVAEAIGCVQDARGDYMGYAGPTNWWRPAYKDGTQGTPADGVLEGADRTYHLASHAGNATLPGDWTEIADTTTWAPGGFASGNGLGVKFNLMACFTRHNSATLNDVSVTAELPEAQKGSYNNVNFLVAVYDGSNGGRHKRLWALYGDGGTDEQLLWAWDDSSADLRPQMDGSGAPYDGFTTVNTTSEAYVYNSGSTGVVSMQSRTMYEFSEPLALQSNKTLWGFKLDDSEPSTNWQARGAVIWAATAFRAGPGYGPPDPQVSTVEVAPGRIPSDETSPAMVTVTLKDSYHNLIYDRAEDITIGVSGDGTSTITFLEEPTPGVYLFAFTNDTPGDKYLQVSVDYEPPEDPIVIDGYSKVTVYDPADVPVADAGPDMIVEDLDESGKEWVQLDGSASTDSNGTIVSYVWSWYGSQIATGQTVAAEFPLGARQIDLTVTDDEGYTDRDSLWVEVRARGYDSSLVQLDISSGFTIDSLFGANEYQALLWYAWDADPDLDGAEAQGYVISTDPAARNPDIGWMVWSQYSNGNAASVNNSRDTASTYHNWWHPAYIDNGLPESGYLAGSAGVDYYMAGTSGNPLLPGDMEAVADGVTLAAQLGPGGYAAPGNGMDIILNTMAAGCAFNTADWQRIEAYAELPVEQQGAYYCLNCVLCTFDSSRSDRGRFMRLAAVYTDDTEEIIWAWTDDDNADTTPYPSELDSNNLDYNMLIQFWDYYTTGGGATGAIATHDYALYEFAAPLCLNNEKILKGLKLYDSSPTTNYNARGIAIFAATASPVGPHGYPDASFSTVEVDPDHIYDDGVDATTITIRLVDAYMDPVGGMANDLSIDVQGDGSNVVSPITETDPGVYTAQMTSDTAGDKRLIVYVWGGYVVLYDRPTVTVTGAGDPQIEVVMEEDLDWVYQNTPMLLQFGGGHRVRLTVNVLDLCGNNEVSVEVAKVDGSGPGTVIINDDEPPSPLTRLIFGSVRGPSGGVGDLVLRVTATGDRAGATVEDVPFTVRLLGDIDADGGVEPTDFSALINALNGSPPPAYHPRAFDLDANGGAEPGDASIMINILNGYALP